MAWIAHFDFEFDQIDVIIKFINGDIEEDIYWQVPEDFRDPLKPNQVCKFQRTLYGLKKAPRKC